MFKSKCSSCAKKVDKGFNFCPYCGNSFKKVKEERNFGMIGRIDSSGAIREELRLPFGMGKIVETLVRQLEKQMNEIEKGNTHDGIPRGFNLKISSGNDQANQVLEEEVVQDEFVSEKEFERRVQLPKVEASSKIKRLSDKIIYEIDAPEVRSKKNIVVTELASGIEVKIYSKDKCFVKFIPIKVDVVEYYLRGEKVFLEFRV